MNFSKNGLEKLIEWEGFENKPYKDSEGYLTIGVGHLLTKDELRSGKISIFGKQVRYSEGLTDIQVKDLLKQDLISRESAVSNLVRVPLSQNQFDVLVSFVFNIGRHSFQNSTLLKVLNLGKYEEVPGQLRRWVYSGGKKVNGLVNRRENEIQLWNDNKVIERRRVEQIKNVAATLEWLMKRSPVKIQGVTFEGKEVFIKYDHSIQQFRMEE